MKSSLAAGIALTVAVLSANAATDHYIIKGSIVRSDFVSEASVGDPFTVQFDLDTSVARVYDPAVPSAGFIDSITNLTFSLDPGAAGTYGGGSIVGPTGFGLLNNYGGWDGMSFSYAAWTNPPGWSFAPAGGINVGSFGIYLYSSADILHFDATHGFTFAEIMPVIELESFDIMRLVSFLFPTNKYIQGEMTSIERVAPKVPDGGVSGILTLTTIMGLALFRRIIVR